MFGVVPKTIWNKTYPADENNLVNLAMRCLLVIDGGRKILIDCGMGEKMDPALSKYYFQNGDDSLQKSLDRLGVNAADITDLVLTHLHFDHCGGAVKPDGSLMFPNATHWVSREQWDSAHAPNDRERPSFFGLNFDPLAEAGRIELIETTVNLGKNLELRLFQGHSTGQIIPFINLGHRTLVYVADFIPTWSHVQLSFISAYDIRPLVALAEKKAFLQDAVEQDCILFLEHDQGAECCTLQSTLKGVRVKDSFALTDRASAF